MINRVATTPRHLDDFLSGSDCAGPHRRDPNHSRISTGDTGTEPFIHRGAAPAAVGYDTGPDAAGRNSRSGVRPPRGRWDDHILGPSLPA